MNCSTCGANIPDGSKFCSECGATVMDLTQALAQVAEATGVTETQFIAPATPSPEASYDSLGADYMTPAMEPAPKKNTPLIAAAVALIVALIALGAVIAWKTGLFDRTPTPASTPEPAPVEHVLGKTKVSFSINAPYYDEPGSRLRLEVAGTTAEGKTVNITVFVTPNASDPETIELEDGAYTYQATGSPISANGVIYDYGDIEGSFTLNAGEDKEETLPSIEVELAPIDPLEVADEQIEAAVESAAGDEACAGSAEELGQAAAQLRDEYVKAAEEEAARIAAEEAARQAAEEEAARRAAEEAAIGASSPLNTEWFYIDNVPDGWTFDITQLSDTEWDVQAEYGHPDEPGNGGQARIKVDPGNGFPEGYMPQGAYEETLIGTSLGSDGLYYHIYAKGVAGGTVIDQSGMYGATITIKNPV